MAGFADGNIGMPGLVAYFLPRAYTVTLSPVSVAANTSAEQTLTLTGGEVNDLVVVTKPTAQAGLGIVGARISAANTVALTFMNATGSPIVPTASEAYKFILIRTVNPT